jgi:UDP-N-acetyl-D-glucosamine dehydrogenase
MDLIVVGQGYVGLPLAVAAAKAGFVVHGFDIDKLKIENLKLGITDSPEVNRNEILELQATNYLSFTNTIPKINKACIYVIAVPTPLDKQKKPDISMLKNACELISSVVNDFSLIINESTSYIGTLNNLVKPLIESTTGLQNLDFAVAPERIDPGNKKWNLRTTPRVIAGIDDKSTKRAVDFYSKFCDKVHVVSDSLVAEASKLIENSFRLVNIALVNEVAQLSDALNFSTSEAIAAASTKPYGFMPFFPGIGVGGHCIPIDPSYLEYSAEQVGLETKMISVANKINSSTPKNLAIRIQEFLGGNLDDKLIQLAGIAYKPNTSDIRESPVLEFYNQLNVLGAKVFWHDPLVQKWNGSVSKPLDSQIDLGIITTPHDQIDFSIWKNSDTQVIDLSSNQKFYGWPKFY